MATPSEAATRSSKFPWPVLTGIATLVAVGLMFLGGAWRGMGLIAFYLWFVTMFGAFFIYRGRERPKRN